jgi:hypothetical protein
MLVQNMKVQLVRPPVPDRLAASGFMCVSSTRYRAIFLGTHDIGSFRCMNLWVSAIYDVLSVKVSLPRSISTVLILRDLSTCLAC